MRIGVWGTMNLTWPEVADAVQLAEELGFDSFHTSDHLMAVAGFDSTLGLLDALSLVTALAPLTRRMRLGCLVSPITMRHPVILARALQTVDVISGGRVDAGLGAGWNPDEHAAFGLAFPPLKERLALLEDACATITALWERHEPAELDGSFPLHGAQLAPAPVQRRAPLLIAGASPGALRITAKWARWWNATGSPALLAERIAALREAEREVGRTGDPVEATASVSVFVSTDADAVAARQAMVPPPPRPGASAQARSFLEGEDPRNARYVGGPDGLADYLAQYATAGVERAFLPMPRPWDPRALELLAAAAGVHPAAS